MTQFYSDPTREADNRSLPDCETFYLEEGQLGDEYKAGWYYWYCFPGCIPEGNPIGPYESESAARRAANEDGIC